MTAESRVVDAPVAEAGTRQSFVGLWLEELVHAVRGLAATPRFSLPALVSLALGIGASTAIFAVFSAVVLRPLPFPNESELVDVGLKGASAADKSGLSARYYSELKEMRSIFASFATYTSEVVTVTGVGEARRVVAARVTPEFFDVLQPPVEAGRTFTAAGPSPDLLDVAVIGHGYWLSAYGGAPALGQIIVVEGEPKTIVGVIGDDRGLAAGTEVWTPVRYSEGALENRFSLFLSGVGRLAPGLSVEVAGQMLRSATEQQNLHVPDGSLVYGTLGPLRDELVGNTRSSVALMMAAVAAFLFLACANVAALLATRASVRARELAIRSALGASPGVLARASALEAMVLVAAGSMLGLGLAFWLVSATNGVYGEELAHTPARLDARVLVGFVALALVSAGIVGIAPAVYALRVRPMETLRSGSRGSSSRASRRFRELLVALQVAATVVLLATAALLVRSVMLMHAADLGFDGACVGARVLYSPLYKDDYARTGSFARAVLDRAEHLPGVRSAAIASDLPFDGSTPSLGLELEPGAPNKVGYADVHLVSPNYFRTMGMNLLAGRYLTDADLPPEESAVGTRPVVVNRTFAKRLLGTESAIGHRFHPTQSTPAEVKLWYEIVGVVEDTLDVSLTRAVEPAAYFPFTTEVRFWGTGFAVVVRGDGDPAMLLEALPRLTREVDRDAPVYDAEVLGRMVARSYRERTSLEKLLTAFAIASIVLAGIGLFGVTSYAVAERSNEIGIRRALGASRGDIMAMVLREAAVIVGIGVVAGLACAWAARSLVSSFLYGITAADPVVYVAVGIAVAASALAATIAPARTAASVPPARALEAS